MLKRISWKKTKAIASLKSACSIPPSSQSEKQRDNVSSGVSTSLLEFSASVGGDVQHFRVIPDFVTAEEEQSVLKEVTRALRGRKYQYDHWDGAIEGYKETEKTQWTNSMSLAFINKLRREASVAAATNIEEESPNTTPNTIEETHVLDLAADGEIKPHIDSVKFCGDVIAGVSLLSSCVMSMQHQENPAKWIHALLPRRSLYIMRYSIS